MQEAPRSVTLSDPRVTQPSFQRFYLVPSYPTAKPGDAEALDLLGHILGRGSNSRLYQALVVEKGIATSAGASYEGTALDQTKFRIYGSPKPGTSLAQLEDAMDGVLAELVDKGLPVPLDEVLTDQRRRDKDDTERAIAPLKPAPDAMVVDTTGMDLGEVVERCYRVARERLAGTA